MYNVNSCQNGVSFTAKMDISGVKKGAKRLQNIAQAFEEKTKKYPDDTFEITDFGDEGIQIFQYDKGNANEHCADISPEQWNKFLEYSDEKIVKKLVKLFNIFKKEDKIVAKSSDFLKVFGKTPEADNFDSKFWDIIVDKMKTDTSAAIEKDSVLKNLGVYY